MAQINIFKKADVGGKMTFSVEIIEDDGKTSHIVLLSQEYYEKLTDSKITTEELITRSFVFLLARESKEAILPEFDLNIISLYFPEYERTIIE